MSQIKIIRSSRRKKTVQAKKIDDILHVYLPNGLSSADEQKWVDKMVNQWEQHEKKRQLNSDNKLKLGSQKINDEYFHGELDFFIEFVANQQKRFGSCSPHTKMIRISDRVSSMPHWVQDYVILHELTHLVFPDHSPNFWEKVNEYRLTERARGYLIAVGLDDEINK